MVIIKNAEDAMVWGEEEEELVITHSSIRWNKWMDFKQDYLSSK